MAYIQFLFFKLTQWMVDKGNVSFCRRLADRFGMILSYVLKGQIIKSAFIIQDIPEVENFEKAKEIAGRRYTNFLHLMVENAGIDRLIQGKPFWETEIENENFLRSLYEKGKGVILISVHIGNWEYGGAVLGLNGYKVSAVAREALNPYVEKDYQRKRELTGVNIIRPGENASVKVLKTLKRGEIVVFIVDLQELETKVTRKLAGCEVDIVPGPFKLANRLGLPILPVVTYRESFNKMKIHYFDPIFPPEDQENDEKINFLINEFCKNVEPYLINYPDQWLQTTA